MTIAKGSIILAADLANGANVPDGLIILWHGTIASIPSGWVICDGNNGTPNLLGKFVEGVATAATDPGSTGGTTSKTTDSHNHGGATVGHRHWCPMAEFQINEDYYAQGGWQSVGGKDGSPSSDPNWNYLSGTETDTATISGDTDSVSDIKPKYYTVAYLMKS